MPDIPRLLKKVIRGRGRLDDAVRLYNAALRLPRMVEALQQSAAGDSMPQVLQDRFLKGLEAGANDSSNLIALVESVVDFEQSKNHKYVIKADFDDDLNEIAVEIKAVEKDIHTAYRDVCLSFVFFQTVFSSHPFIL